MKETLLRVTRIRSIRFALMKSFSALKLNVLVTLYLDPQFWRIGR